MSTFTPQLTIPTAGDPYYNTKANGGYNPCILGNNDNGQRAAGLNVLPNCVGWATGRFNAIGNYGACKYLGNTNAANFVDLARRQGLQISDKPTLGGCVVWGGGPGGYGHVAIVERLQGTKIQTSESEWYGKAFVTYLRDGYDWTGGCYWMRTGYRFLGCIVNPAVKEETPVTYEQFCAFMDRYLADRAQQPTTNDETARRIQRVKDYGLMGGDPDGNFRPHSWTTREELAIVLSNLIPDR